MKGEGLLELEKLFGGGRGRGGGRHGKAGQGEGELGM